MGIGIFALVYGRWDTIGYLWLAAGALMLGTGAAAWAYRRRHPLPTLPPGKSWKDALG